MAMLTPLFLSSLMLGQTATTPPSAFQKAMADFQADYAQRQKDKLPITADWYYGNAEKYVKAMDFTKFSVDDGFSFLDSPFMYAESGPSKLYGFAQSVKIGKDDNGWKGSVLKFRSTMFEIKDMKIDAKKVRGSMMGVAKHARTAAMLQTQTASPYFDGVMEAATGGYLDNASMTAFAKSVEQGVFPMLSIQLPDMFIAWANKSGANDSSPVWAMFRNGLAASAKMVKADDKRANAMMARSMTKMESTMGRGRFMNSVAPEITFKWSSDPSIKKLSDLRGKVVVLDFWATWCGPCIASMPKIRELQAHYKDKPVVILGVTSIQEGFWEGGKKTDLKGKAEEEMSMYPGYMQRQNVTWNVAVSDQDVFNPEYGVDGIPHMAILDGQGRVRQSGIHPGAVTLEQKIAMIDPLIAELKK